MAPADTPQGPAVAGDSVLVHYTGRLDTGTVFDSSREGDPLAFTLGGGQVIPGFDTGVTGLSVGESANIRGQTDRDLKKIESEAYRKVQEVMGDADAQATAIYASAHNRDPELYKLVKRLESYQKSIDADTTVILSTESDFYRGLTKMTR